MDADRSTWYGRVLKYLFPTYVATLLCAIAVEFVFYHDSWIHVAHIMLRKHWGLAHLIKIVDLYMLQRAWRSTAATPIAWIYHTTEDRFVKLFCVALGAHVAASPFWLFDEPELAVSSTYVIFLLTSVGVYYLQITYWLQVCRVLWDQVATLETAIVRVSTSASVSSSTSVSYGHVELDLSHIVRMHSDTSEIYESVEAQAHPILTLMCVELSLILLAALFSVFKDSPHTADWFVFCIFNVVCFLVLYSLASLNSFYARVCNRVWECVPHARIRRRRRRRVSITTLSAPSAPPPTLAASRLSQPSLIRTSMIDLVATHRFLADNPMHFELIGVAITWPMVWTSVLSFVITLIASQYDNLTHVTNSGIF
jgi:hypothetical protein